MATDYDITNLAPLSITELYGNEELLRYVMDRIGISIEQCRNKIVSDGFDSIRSIVHHHSNDVEGFRTYLTGLNKTFVLL